MNNEPVAWMVDGVLFNSLGAALNISFDIEQPCIPLYTHPVKEPTDDEVKEYYESTYETYAQYEGFVEGVKWASKITKVLNVPVKTLENEEFIKLAEESGFMLVSSHPQDMENALYECFPDEINSFARALLRKAEEK